MPEIPRMNPSDFIVLAPKIVLAVWGLLVLTVDFALLRRRATTARRQILGALSLVGGALALLAVGAPGWVGYGSAARRSAPMFFGTLDGGLLSEGMDTLLLVLLLLVVVMSMTWNFTEHWGEYFALLLWSTVGMMFLVAAEELLILFLTLEMMTICLYLAAAFEKGKRRSAEGGLKYFVYGSVSSALFLFGLSLIYGMAGSTRFSAIGVALFGGGAANNGLSGNVAGATALLLILVGFGFKIAAVPFHQWAPDAYEGAPAPVTAWIATGSKVASVVALMKVLLHALGPWSSGVDAQGAAQSLSPGWIGLLAVIAAATMTFGNFAALAQRNLKRMLAYSSISHAGYILVGVLAAAVSVDHAGAVAAVLFYLVVYSFSTIGAVAAAAWLARDVGSDDIDDLNGLGRRSPLLGVCLTLLMLSLIGMPPLAGFVGKFMMFGEALDARVPGRVSFLWLGALGLFNSVVSAFYYVRVLKAMFLRDPKRASALGPAPASVWVPIVASTLVVVGFGLQATPLLGRLVGPGNTPLLAGLEHRPPVLPARQGAAQLPTDLPDSDDNASPTPTPTTTTTPPEPTPPPASGAKAP